MVRRSFSAASLNYREELEVRQEEVAPPFSPEDYASFCGLFTNYSKIGDCRTPFSITADHDGVAKFKLTAKIDWFTEEFDEEQGISP